MRGRRIGWVFPIFLLVFGITRVAIAGWWQLPQLPSGAVIRDVNRYYEVTPKIARADSNVEVVIRPLYDHCRFKPEARYQVTYTALDQYYGDSPIPPGVQTEVKPAEDGNLHLNLFLAAEQVHVLVLEESVADKKKTIGPFAIYSLKEDLFRLRPWKGDFHMHSHHSDGVESPAYVAGACRRVGLDFMALTDHHKHAPSMEAADFYRNVPIDLKIYGGEEIHAPDNPVHIVAFGTREGVSQLYKDNPDGEKVVREAIGEIQKSLGNLPEGVNPWHAAACRWVTDRIHERGGIAMLCHPYWVTRNAHNVGETMLDYLLRSGMFDMLELVSGDDWESIKQYDQNALQAAMWQNKALEGLQVPVVGISDTHGMERSEQFGRNYTVCFAPSSELADLQQAMKSGMAVAVETVRGDRPLVYGSWRLVKFTHFLLKEVFPQHDELCYEEGRLMLQYAAGDTSALPLLEATRGRTARLYDSFWMK
ncbi:MAG TPA: hypothetical protein PK349_01005 [Candidatus Hydrogenedentes bacterium]|nr:hypothetical protein [Candidatus Hydrogenedentota bacterium]